MGTPQIIVLFRYMPRIAGSHENSFCRFCVFFVFFFVFFFPLKKLHTVFHSEYINLHLLGDISDVSLRETKVEKHNFIYPTGFCLSPE